MTKSPAFLDRILPMRPIIAVDEAAADRAAERHPRT